MNFDLNKTAFFLLKLFNSLSQVDRCLGNCLRIAAGGAKFRILASGRHASTIGTVHTLIFSPIARVEITGHARRTFL